MCKSMKNKNSTPLVSVVVPNYNHARYLPQRLDSILQQSYQHIEIIIIDDCSTDHDQSREVIESYRENPKISRIIYNEQNSGNTFSQWQAGIRAASGGIIWIAESDDYCEPTMLERLVDAYQAHPDSSLVYTTCHIVDSEGHVLSKSKKRPTQHYSGEHYLRHYLMLGNMVRNASTAIFSRQAALNIKADYTQYSGAGDYLFWIAIAEQGSVGIINQQLSYYRQHTTNITSNCNSDGSNLKGEYQILQYLIAHHPVSHWRMKLAYRFRQRRITSIDYASPAIRQQILTLWHAQDRPSILSNLHYRIFKLVRSLFNYYI